MTEEEKIAAAQAKLDAALSERAEAQVQLDRAKALQSNMLEKIRAKRRDSARSTDTTSEGYSYGGTKQ